MWFFDCHAYAFKTKGIWGHAPPGKFLKLDALRLLLRNRSRAAVVIHGSCNIAFNFWLCMYAFARQLTSKFSREKVLRLAELQVG